MNDVIRTQSLAMRFGRHQVLSSLDLSVARGSIYALIGSNGAGKTTTLKILLRLIHGFQGHAEILGVPSSRIGAREYERIGYVSENQELPDAMTVAQMLAYWRPFYERWDVARERELAGLFRLPLDRKLGHCSRGIRMKAALASSLAYRPELLILDEPFSGLDPLVRDELSEALLSQAGESTVLISSHDLAEIENFASHVGYLDEGRLQFSEEMPALAARFREVEVTLEQAVLPAQLPPTWMRTEAASSMVRFVETAWDPERTQAELNRVFPKAREVAVRAMPLRSIFVTLAKAAREAA